MLIFTRRVGEALKIGSDITLTLIDICNNEARICVIVGEKSFIFTGGLGKSLAVGNGVTVTILVIKESEIRLGVETKTNIPVHRQEREHRLGLYCHDNSTQLV